MISLQKQKKKLQKVEQLYMDGVITNGERYNKVISIWAHATADVATRYDQQILKNKIKQAFVNADKEIYSHLIQFL